MVAQASYRTSPAPFGLAVSGEASEYVDALRRIVGSPWLETYPVDSDAEMLELVRGGLVDAAVLDETAMRLNALQMLRMIHRLNETMLVVILTVRPDRRLLEQALNLAAFSVVCKPLHLEELLCQIHRMIHRLNETMLVVILTVRPDRRLLEQALNLAAFSVVCKPLHLEVLLYQIHRMMTRLDECLRRGPF